MGGPSASSAMTQPPRAWAVKGECMGRIGAGSLEHPRQWLGAQWAGRVLPREEAAQERSEEPSWGTANGGL